MLVESPEHIQAEIVPHNPEQVEDRAVTMAAIRGCLGEWRKHSKKISNPKHLSRKQALVVYLRFYADLDLGEIARITDMKHRTVVTHMERAYTKLCRAVGVS